MGAPPVRHDRLIGILLGNSIEPSRTDPDRHGGPLDATAGQATCPHRPGPVSPTGVILKIGRSAVRPRPWPPEQMSPDQPERRSGLMLISGQQPSDRADCSRIAHDGFSSGSMVRQKLGSRLTAHRRRPRPGSRPRTTCTRVGLASADTRCPGCVERDSTCCPASAAERMVTHSRHSGISGVAEARRVSLIESGVRTWRGDGLRDGAGGARGRTGFRRARPSRGHTRGFSMLW